MANLDLLLAARHLEKGKRRTARRGVPRNFLEAQDVRVKRGGFIQVVDPVTGVEKFSNHGRTIRFQGVAVKYRISRILLISIIVSKFPHAFRILEFLTKLLNTPTPSSEEHRGQRVWLDYVGPFADKVETDTYGNALAILNPKGSPKIMVEGHADEIAFQIQYIDDDGFIYFSGVGGHDPALARGQRVHIHSRNGEVLGVIGALAIHMQGGKKQEVPELHELFIDIGAANRKEAEKRVAVGDLITYIVGWQQLNGEIYIARACDNRIGTFVAAEVLRLCKKAGKKLKANVVAASAIGEGKRALRRGDDRLFRAGPMLRSSSMSARRLIFPSPTKSASAIHGSARVRS